MFIATIGTFIEISGANFDITLHLHRQPGGERLLVDAETFLSPSHTILYSGVIISAAIGLRLLWKYNHFELNSKLLWIRDNCRFYSNNAEVGYTELEDQSKSGSSTGHDSLLTFSPSFISAFKILALGSGLTLIAGPFDLWWHSTFGLDGLLSPPHLFLITGMFVSALAVSIGLSRMVIGHVPMSFSKMKLVRAATILAFATLWISSTWLVYAFILPASKGQQFDFNMNPIAASLIAIIALPLIGSLIFITAANVLTSNSRFSWYATIVVMIVIGTNVFANILTVGQLTPFLPWYLVFTIIPAVVADILLSKTNNSNIRNEVSGTPLLRSTPSNINNLGIVNTRTVMQLIVGAMIGSTFYILYFPMLTLTFERLYGVPLGSVVQNLLPNFLGTLSLSLAITIMPGALVGMIGAIIFAKKMRSVM